MVEEKPGASGKWVRRGGRPTAEISQQKHQAILDAAFDQFVRVGFRGASMREIAAQAQISTRTLYNRYSDKLALFDACVELTAANFTQVELNLQIDLHTWLVDYVHAMHSELMSERSRQITMLVYREGADFDELRQIARTRYEKIQLAPVVERLAHEGIRGEIGYYLAEQFVGLALGEWQRRLVFGGSLMTEAEVRYHAHTVSTLFVEGARATSRARETNIIA